MLFVVIVFIIILDLSYFLWKKTNECLENAFTIYEKSAINNTVIMAVDQAVTDLDSHHWITKKVTSVFGLGFEDIAKDALVPKIQQIVVKNRFCKLIKLMWKLLC